jgi:hypothetical protein
VGVLWRTVGQPIIDVTNIQLLPVSCEMQNGFDLHNSLTACLISINKVLLLYRLRVFGDGRSRAFV